jgi:hypothetical protein
MKKQRFATWKSPSVVPQWWTEALQNGIWRNRKVVFRRI